jgi:C4-dicarboxylate transporter, DctQ subunit
MRIRSAVSHILDLVLRLGGALAGTIMVAIMAMVTIKVFMRYVLGYGWVGVDQITGTLLLYMTFLGAAWVLHREGHVTIDFVVTRLPTTLRLGAAVANAILCASVSLLVFAYGAMEVAYSLERGIRVAAELEIPRAVNLVAIPVGFLFLWIQFSRRAWHALQAARQGDDRAGDGA